MKMPFLEDWSVTAPGMLWGVPEGADAMALIHLAHEMRAGRFISPLMITGWRGWPLRWRCLGLILKPCLNFRPGIACPMTAYRRGVCSRASVCIALLNWRLLGKKPRIVLTTINAWLQKVPPRTMFSGASLKLKAGDTISAAELTRFFVANAYHRADTVRESGEFAIRGGIVDVSPPGATEPVRIDFFDTEIETIRHFDPETQRSTGKADRLALHPVSEFILNDETISAFRGRYLEQFGAEASRDPLYLSVSEGRHHPGMEHMLPLFHDQLDHLSDYTGAAPVIMADEIEAAARHRLGQITDFHAARTEAMEISHDQDSSSIWRPFPRCALSG